MNPVKTTINKTRTTNSLMVKFVRVVDDSDLPVLGIVYSGDGLIVGSSFSFSNKRAVGNRLKGIVEFAAKRGKVLTSGRSKDLKLAANSMLGKVRASLSDELIRLALLDKLDWSYLTDFEKRVFYAVMGVPIGQTSTYGEIARNASSSPRAVGQALRRNPFSPIIPCHRIVRSDGSLGGFLGQAKSKDKAFMLQYEAEIAHELKEKRFVSWR